MLRFLLLGLIAVVMGLTAGWMVSAKTPAASASRAPIGIASAHTGSAPSTPATLTPTTAADAPEATSEPSGSHAARKRKQLKSRLAAAASAKPGVQVGRCSDDDDDDDEC